MPSLIDPSIPLAEDLSHSQGDQEIHLASARSLFLFLLVFHQTRCAFSGEVDVRLAVAPDDRNGKATWQLSYCCPQGHW